jgi:D-alanyl-D-alanine carboxypeptidase (penicillin-binding protein 5/6)
MRGIGIGIGLACVASLGMTAPARAWAPLTARAAIIMDASSGEVLWEHDADEPLPPASTTKVMTAILALESGRLDDPLTVSTSAAAEEPSKINLRPGQRMRLRHLLYAILLNSANDAAEVIAEGLGGSQAGFAAHMNARAHALGAQHAHFVNPHGLTADAHVASARDLAVLFRHGLTLPLFREILSTRSIQVPLESNGVRNVSLHSHNRLLTGWTYQVIGKTGYTRPARRCFVGAASHDGREIIIALLGATDLWGDARKLFLHGFAAGEEGPGVTMAGLLPMRAVGTSQKHVHPVVAEGDDDATDAARYAVQLGPYGSRRAANAARARLASRGYTAVLSGRTLRIGSFSSRQRAGRVVLRLRVTGYRPTIVALR